MRTLILLLASIALVSGCGLETTAIVPTDTVLFEDSFDRADGVIGASWGTAGGGTITISSNRLHPQNTGAASPAALNVTAHSQIGLKATVDLVISGGNYSGEAYIVGKSSSTSSVANSYICGIDSSGKISIGKVTSGTTTGLASQNTVTPLTNGSTYTLTYTSTGGLFGGFAFGCSLKNSAGTTLGEVSVTDGSISHQNYQYWGLFGGANGANFLYFDNFKIVVPAT
jgi:hypothetical protein